MLNDFQAKLYSSPMLSIIAHAHFSGMYNEKVYHILCVSGNPISDQNNLKLVIFKDMVSYHTFS